MTIELCFSNLMRIKAFCSVIFLLTAPLTHAIAADFIDVAVGNGFVCGLDRDGSVDCSAPATLIERVTPPANLPPLVSLAAGSVDVCGIDEAGAVHCWGTNLSGTYQAPQDLLGFESLSVGVQHWCGITVTRNIHCEGSNDFGESTTPEPFTAYNQVLARWQSTCGRRSDNSVHCWGDGGPNRQEMAPFVGPLVYMMPQSRSSCGIDGNDLVVCDGAPVPGFNGTFRRMTASYWGMCAIEYNGGIQCVVDPTRDLSRIEEIVLDGLALDDVPVGGNFAKIDGRYTDLSCALGYDGNIACWGSRAKDLRIPGTTNLLATPDGLRADTYSGNTIELFWTPENRPQYVAPRIRVYEVWRDNVLVTTTSGSSYYDDSLTPGVDYSYKVKALGFDAASISLFSDTLIVNTLPGANSGGGQGGDSASGGSPLVEGNMITLFAGGWYQVQRADTLATVCEGTTSCTATDGTYIVINHTTGERWENIVVLQQPVSAVSAVTVSGLTIRWPNDGWYQVQDSSSYQSVCEGGQSCKVAAGTYTVINHTNGTRWDDIVVSTENGDGSGGSTGSNGVGGPQVNGLSISWENNGWYQVQDAFDYSTICEGGTSCTVVVGSYNVINLTTGERWLATVE